MRSVAVLPSLDTVVLERLRSGQSAEVLIEFEVASVRQQANTLAAASGRQTHGPVEVAYQRTEFARIKADALVGLQGIMTLRAYENLPTSFVRVDSEASLLALLARSGVRAVFENRTLAPLVAETFPFINQPAVEAAGVDGAGTAVAIIDSGVDYTRSVFGPCAQPPGTPAPGDRAAALRRPSKPPPATMAFWTTSCMARGSRESSLKWHRRRSWSSTTSIASNSIQPDTLRTPTRSRRRSTD